MPYVKTATLDFPSISTQSAAELTIDVPGAQVGDVVSLGIPAGFQEDLVAMGYVSAADTVTVRVINATAGAIDPASGTFRVMVDR